MKTKKITVEELNGVVQIEEDLIKKGLPYFLKRCQRGEIQGAIEKNKGSVFTFGETYYYKHGRTPEALRDKVEKKLREAGYGTEALTWGDNYCTFHGGCKPMSAKDSFFWVTFIIKRKTDAAGEKQEEEKLAEDWQPQKGEEVYAFQASRRRVVRAPVRSVSGSGTIVLGTPDGERSCYKFHWVGRTPEEAMNKALTQAITERNEYEKLINFLIVHKDGETPEC